MKKANVLEEETKQELEAESEKSFKFLINDLNSCIREKSKRLRELEQEKQKLHERWDNGERDFVNFKS